jgi:hypothetical protein
VVFSILAFGLACYAIARIVMHATGSHAGTMLAVVLFGLDPNVLYLQSTPMTEPLLFGLTLLSVSLVYDWIESGAAQRPRAAGWALAGACLTRYEAWCVVAVLVALALVALIRRGLPIGTAINATAQLAGYPALAIVAFILHSRFTIGEWLVTDGFFVTDPRTMGNLFGSFLQVSYGIRTLTSDPLVVFALAGVGMVLVGGWTSRDRAPQLALLALAAFVVLPTYAFYEGHPFRMRYMIAPVVGVALFCGIALGTLRGRSQQLALVAVGLVLAMTLRPLGAAAPMVEEAQWDRANIAGRHQVTECLMPDYHHEPILASMASLAPYMQELSHEGLGIRDFVHEGNLPYWQEAIESPKGRVGWILIEERAEGGDALEKRARASSAFLLGFTRVCAGGGVALYKATSWPSAP